MAESQKDPLLGPRFRDALQYAADLHARQTRKGTRIPYIAHLLSVSAIVLEDGGDEDEAVAALLHDAVEDQGGRPVLDEIRRRFGERVALIVEGCTDAEVVPKPPWRERKEEYIAHLRFAAPDVLRVSTADKLHNARAILADFRRHGEALWNRFTADREGVLWYYRALVTAYQAKGGSPLTEELDRVVSEIERLAAGDHR
jgi:(p)ppGpp synthase/HD superfamily hydrolase